MIPRLLKHELIEQLKEYPVVTVLGPRQAGKTTLVRSCLPDYEYVNLENPEMRALAEEDPKGLLNQSTRPVIFDEIQRVPRLISYIQSIVDERSGNGQFVLTGSHQLQLRDNISQSLAGRTGLLHLLPLSIQELHAANIQFDRFEDYLFHGSLPRVYDQNQRPHTAYANYYQTYVERDVRQLIQLKDASLFEKFMRLLAGRVGQIMNHQSMANDAGVDGKTIKHWLSILEASYIVFPLKPYFKTSVSESLNRPNIISPILGYCATSWALNRLNKLAATLWWEACLKIWWCLRRSKADIIKHWHPTCIFIETVMAMRSI